MASVPDLDADLDHTQDAAECFPEIAFAFTRIDGKPPRLRFALG